MELKRNNVVYNTWSKRKFVIIDPRDMLINEAFVCETPHEDEDYSYMCANKYCRCRS